MNWHYYKVDYLYNDDLEDFQTISSTSPLDKAAIKEWLSNQIGDYVEKFKIKEVGEIEPAEQFNNNMFKFKRKLFPED